MTDGAPQYDFDIAVSFAGEDRALVVDIVEQVKEFATVFYDEDYLTEAWGRDGVEYFTDVYMSRARFAIVFVSSHYAAKVWTNLERKAALARALTERGPYVLPIRLDDTQLDGILPTTIFLDARRLGIDGLVSAIRTKVAGRGAVADQQTSTWDGKVPTTPEGLQVVVTERPAAWEYLLFAGTLLANMDALDGKLHDFTAGYAAPNGRHVAREEFVDFAQRAIAEVRLIVGNLEPVMDTTTQERAFGKPGAPGDPTRISHLAGRMVSIYESLLDWAASLRGTATFSDAGEDALRALARFADEPVADFRRFVKSMVADLDEHADAIAAGESVSLTAALVLKLPDSVTDDYLAKVATAMEG
jgi:hypothetical protein